MAPTFILFQQRLLAFLSAEVTATGEAFEHGNDGAAEILSRLSAMARDRGAAGLDEDISRLVERLQDADRRRQELQQVAGALTVLMDQVADLPDAVPDQPEAWCRRQELAATLGDWRSRLSAALRGLPEPDASDQDDDVCLF